MRGLDADPGSERLLERRTEAEGELTGQQITAVLAALRGGNILNGRPPDRLFRVDIALRYPKVAFCQHKTQVSMPCSDSP